MPSGAVVTVPAVAGWMSMVGRRCSPARKGTSTSEIVVSLSSFVMVKRARFGPAISQGLSGVVSRVYVNAKGDEDVVSVSAQRLV